MATTLQSSNIDDIIEEELAQEVDGLDDEEKNLKVEEGTLTFNQISDENCIDMLHRTADGTSLAFIRLDCSQKALKNIDILENYIHLRYVNLSSNELTSVDVLNNLKSLMYLNIEGNILTEVKLDSCPYLQVLIANNNKLKSFEDFSPEFKNLTHLSLNFNQISDMKKFPAVPNLKMLEMRGNRLVEIDDLLTQPNVKRIEELFIPANDLKSLKGLKNMSSLKKIHARDNIIMQLDFEDISCLKKLSYLNLRNNRIEDLNEIKNLQENTSLKSLNLMENKITVTDDYRVNVLAHMNGKLKTLDKTEFGEDENGAALEIMENLKEGDYNELENEQKPVE